MGMFCAVGGTDVELGPGQLHELLAESLGKLGRRERVLAVPPDITRLHSQAGALTCAAVETSGRSSEGGSAGDRDACGDDSGADGLHVSRRAA